MTDSNSTIPYGYCHCGCGEKTKIAQQTRRRYNWIKGQPFQFLHGHRVRLDGVAPDIQTEMCRLYLAGWSAPTLANHFDVSSHTVYSVLKRNGYQARRRTNRYTHDHHFFDSIDSEQKAYWLGFIAADGCIAKESVLTILLAEKDRAHLELFQSHLKSNHLIYKRTTDAFGGSYPGATLQIASIDLTNGLKAHGITPRKSLTHEWPNFLPDHLLVHYVRGYFDGDGSFTKPINNNKHYRAAILGSELFLQGLRQFLADHCNLPLNQVCKNRRNGKILALSYGGRLRVQTFARWLYHDATIYLARKRKKIAHLL